MKKQDLPHISNECEYHDVSSSDIESLFHRIKVSLGLEVSTTVCAASYDGQAAIAVG